jgi:hypothetical protein
MDTDMRQLKDQVEELLKWKEERERQQLTYPLDKESMPVLNQHYLKVYKPQVTGANVKYAGIDNTTLVNTSELTASGTKYKAAITVGEETVERPGGSESSLNSQVYIENNDDDTKLSFFYGYRKPLYRTKSGTTVSVTSGGSTITDTNKSWTTDELAGAYIYILNSSNVLQFTRQIASNTATEITIDGTWPSSVSDATYFVFLPMLLGSPEYPWWQIYAGGFDVSSGGTGAVRRAIRMGYGPTSLSIGIFYGTGSPESAVTANVGSLYLRTDGGAGTTLYIKESGTSNTGWAAK